MYTLATGTIFTFSRAEEAKEEVVAARGTCARYLGMEEGYPVLRVLSRLFDDAGQSLLPHATRTTPTSCA